MDLQSAAVLIPIIEQESGLTVLFTRRTEHLKNHAGQISFPGGRAEAHDQSSAETALREAAEEIGLDPKAVDILGRLPDYSTITGYCVTPVVGLMQPQQGLRADPFEVAEIFEVPLDHLMDPENHQRNTMIHGGQMRHYFAFPYRQHYIWGATAGMLMNFYQHVMLGREI